MARVNVKISGIRKVLESPEVQAELDRRAQSIASAAGPGFVAKSNPHKYTSRAYVDSVTREADEREASDKVLTRALDAGR